MIWAISQKIFKISIFDMSLKITYSRLQLHLQEAHESTHRGRVTHICVNKLTIIGSDNSLSPGRRQAIIWTNAGILLIGPVGTNFSEILIEIYTFSFKKMRLKIPSAKWRPCCLGLNVLKMYGSQLRQQYPVQTFHCGQTALKPVYAGAGFVTKWEIPWRQDQYLPVVDKLINGTGQPQQQSARN